MSTPLKRYLLFAYCYHDAAGGWNDLIGDYLDITAAKEAYEASKKDYGDIVDLTTGNVVISGRQISIRPNAPQWEYNEVGE